MLFGWGLRIGRVGPTPIVIASVPPSLFAAGEQGVWYDPSDMSTLFQDAAGTTPVTATGQPVGRMLDISGRGNHATQDTAGSRPTFRDVDGLRYLEFDGLDDFMVTGNIDFSVTDEVSLFAGMRKNTDAAISVLAELSAQSQNNGSFCLFTTRNIGAGQYGFRCGGTITRDANTANTFSAPRSDVLTGLGDISNDTVSIRVSTFLAFTGTTDQGTGNFGVHPLYIGRRGGTTMPFSGNMYGLLIRGATTSPASIIATERFMATKSGVILP